MWALSGDAGLGCTGHTGRPSPDCFPRPPPGVVAVAIFVLLCVAAVAIRLYQQKSSCSTTELNGPRKQGSSVAMPSCELGGPDAVGGDQQAGF